MRGSIPTVSNTFARKYLPHCQLHQWNLGESVYVTYDTSPFPDHWLNNPTHIAIAVRFRFPVVESNSIHLRFEFSISRWTVVWISSNSALTRALSRSPSAWYLTRISKASSLRSFDTRYLGLSGMNHMKMSCNIDGAIWRSDGIRQLQSFGIANVPSVTPAATIAPAYLCKVVSHSSSPELAENDDHTKTR